MRYIAPILLLAITLPAAATTPTFSGAFPPAATWHCQTTSFQPCTTGASCVNGNFVLGCTIGSQENATNGSMRTLPATLSVKPYVCGTGFIQFTPRQNVLISTANVNNLTLTANPTSCNAHQTCQIAWKTPGSCPGVNIDITLRALQAQP